MKDLRGPVASTFRMPSRRSIVRRVRRRIYRTKWLAWSVQNWVKGYQFRPVRRFRCCGHTWPYHSTGCAAIPMALVADETGGTGTGIATPPGNHTHTITPDPAGAHTQGAPPGTLQEGDEPPPAEPAGDGEVAPGELPTRWEGTLILEGVRTDDGREIAEDALGWRELPLPLMYQEEMEPGHWHSVMAGRIETIERMEDGRIWGTGSFDLEGEGGQEAARQMGAGFLRWVSGDVAVTGWELIEEGDCDLEDILFGGDEDCEIIERVTEGRIMGATLVYFPAFEEATLEPVFEASAQDSELARVAAAGNVKLVRTQPLPLGEQDPAALTAAVVHATAGPVPDEVQPSWFEDPQFSAAQPLTFTRDGRVFGHVAVWEDENGRPACHIGFPDECMPPPRSATGYAYYRTGAAPYDFEDCDPIPVGQITIGTGHADITFGHREALAHYDNTGTAIADVAAGEDEFGIWVAGALRPGVSSEQLRAARAASPSGDWRNIGGNLEMVAVLCVNVPGYPVVRTRVASGRPQALVATAGPRRMNAGTFDQRLDKLARAVRRHGQLLETLRPQITAELRARIRGGKPEEREPVAP